MSHRLRMRGFTLVELLVVIAIIGILVALLLPAIQAARQAALKNSCRNNMKQLALACQNHNDTFKTFPSLWFSNVSGTGTGAKGDMTMAGGAVSYSWIVRLLPFIEEDTLYKSISAKSGKFSVASNASTLTVVDSSGNAVNPGRIRLGQILCPSYSGEPETSTASPAANQASNYIAIPATKTALLTSYSGTFPGSSTTPADGMIIPDKLARGSSMARMADGTSKTAVLGESKEGITQNGASTQYFRWFMPIETYACGWGGGMGATTTKPRFNGTTWEPCAITSPSIPDSIGLNFGINTAVTPNFPKFETATDAPRSFGPSSDHMGGIVIHGMGDGSVQEVTDTGTDAKIYYASITARGGENVPSIGAGN
jgi:prepilin-type N-terminal cleavage/methylation domain-containing protein